MAALATIRVTHSARGSFKRIILSCSLVFIPPSPGQASVLRTSLAVRGKKRGFTGKTCSRPALTTVYSQAARRNCFFQMERRECRESGRDEQACKADA